MFVELWRTVTTHFPHRNLFLRRNQATERKLTKRFSSVIPSTSVSTMLALACMSVAFVPAPRLTIASTTPCTTQCRRLSSPHAVAYSWVNHEPQVVYPSSAEIEACLQEEGCVLDDLEDGRLLAARRWVLWKHRLLPRFLNKRHMFKELKAGSACVT